MAILRRSLLALLTLSAALLASPLTAHESNHSTVKRHLASSPGNVAACYSPMHLQAYPFGREALNMDSLRQSIDDDFALMAKHVTHVRTYYSQFFGAHIAPYAAKHGLKIYLGVYMTTESWGSTELDAAVEAAQQYPDTVEAIIVGNENLHTGASASSILGVVNTIRSRVGATSVKFGTVQRITEYMDANYDGQTKQLEANLDILGVNIYPFFDPNFDGSKPGALVQTLWNNMAKKFDVNKMRLTETGFPTAGPPSAEAPNVFPSLDMSYAYYESLLQWTPEGGETTPKFWFGMFDRRPDDNTMGLEFEKHFGFYTHSGTQKRNGYPLLKTDAAAPQPAPAPAPAPPPAPAPAPAPEPAPAPMPAPVPAPEPQPAPVPAPTPQLEPTQAPAPAPAPQPEPTQAPAPAPVPQPEPTPAPTHATTSPVTSSPDSDAAITPSPTVPTPAATWIDSDPSFPEPKPTPAATTVKPTPVPSSFMKPTPGPSSFMKPTPGPSSFMKPTPGPSSFMKPTPGPSTFMKPTPAPSSFIKPTPAPTSSDSSGSKLRGDSSAASAPATIVGDAEIITASPIVQNDAPSADASARATNSGSIASPSSLIIVLSALVFATIHVL